MRLRTFLQLFRGDILDVGCDEPLVAEGIQHSGHAIAIKLIGGLAIAPGSCCDGLGVHACDLRNR